MKWCPMHSTQYSSWIGEPFVMAHTGLSMGLGWISKWLLQAVRLRNSGWESITVWPHSPFWRYVPPVGCLAFCDMLIKTYHSQWTLPYAIFEQPWLAVTLFQKRRNPFGLKNWLFERILIAKQMWGSGLLTSISSNDLNIHVCENLCLLTFSRV